MSAARYQIHTEARGAHWVAWLTLAGETKPDRSVVLVAADADDARARAERWQQQLNADHQGAPSGTP